MVETCGFKGHVLLVDDEEAILKFLARLLEQRGYKVTTANSAEAALLRLEQTMVDILATDLMMPGIDGVALIGRVKSLYPELQCMMMTGHGEVESAVMAMEAGAFNYLLKPIDIDALDAVLKIGMERVGLIATRKWVEEENARLSSAVEHASEAMAICGTGFEVNYINPAFSNLVKYTLEDITARSFLALLMPEQEDTVTVIRGVVDSRQMWKGDVYLQHMDGQSVLTELSVSPLSDDEGNHDGCIIILRDIREERAMRKKLAHKERAESIGMLAGGIAHDFNNLLTTILGNADLLHMKTKHDAQMSRNVERISHAGKSAAELCQLLLAYAGKGQYIVQQIDLSHAVEEGMHLMDLSVPAHVRMHMKLLPDLPLIEADMAQVHQLVMSLLVNALEAIDEQPGDIIIETGQLMIGEHALKNWHFGEDAQAGGFVFIRIADTGCGMDDATLKKVFEPFFSTKFTGRGLGLSAVAGVMKAAKGLLELQSTVGEGTSVTLAFPMLDNGLASSEVTEESVFNIRAAQDEISAGEVVLIVDDDEDILDIIEVSLEDLGFETMTALDGADAIRIYQEHQEVIVGVLMDMTMPNMNGDKAFIKMAEINPEVQVILSSGYTETEIMEKSGFTKAVPVGFLQKPYSISELQRFVQEKFKKMSTTKR